MSLSRIVGIILVVVGIVLLVFAWSSSNAVVDKVTAAAKGRFTQSTMAYLIAGLVSAIGGAALVLGGRPKA